MSAPATRWLMVHLTDGELEQLRGWAIRNGYGTDGAGRRLLQLGLTLGGDPHDGPADAAAAALRWIRSRP